MNSHSPNNLGSARYTIDEDTYCLAFLKEHYKPGGKPIPRLLTDHPELSQKLSRNNNGIEQRLRKLVKKHHLDDGNGSGSTPIAQTSPIEAPLEPRDFIVLEEQPPAESPSGELGERITWCTSEVEALAVQCFNQRMNNLMEPLTVILNKAQHTVLPKHRWRAISLMHKGIQEGVERRVRALILRALEEPEPTFIEVELPAPEVPPEVTLAKMPTEVVASFLLGRLMKGFGSATSALEALGQYRAPAASAPAPAYVRPNLPTLPPEPAKPHLLRIWITGLLAIQEQEVLSKTKHMPVRLYFGTHKDKDRAEVPRSCEYAIVHRHSRHGHFQAAQDAMEHKPGQRVFFSPGGVSRVISIIEEIVKREKL